MLGIGSKRAPDQNFLATANTTLINQNMKKHLLKLADNLNIQNFFKYKTGDNITTILYHNFNFESENLQISKDRLKYQCDWIKREFSPSSAEQIFHNNVDEKRGEHIVVTIDDAKKDFIWAREIFKEFEIPITLFVCTGWSANLSEIDSETLLSSIVSTLEWAPDQTLERIQSFDNPYIGFKRPRQEIITDIIKNANIETSFLWKFYEFMNSNNNFNQRDIVGDICSMSEISTFAREGISIGNHTVSHVRLASANTTRIHFEISEAQRLLEKNGIKADQFAYPYGTLNTANAKTTKTLIKCGINTAFLTNSNFANFETPRLYLPRISLPNKPMPLSEYKVRVRGAGVPWSIMKNKAIGLMHKHSIYQHH